MPSILLKKCWLLILLTQDFNIDPKVEKATCCQVHWQGSPARCGHCGWNIPFHILKIFLDIQNHTFYFMSYLSQCRLFFFFSSQRGCLNKVNWMRTRQSLRLLFSHSTMSHSLQPHGLQHARLPCSSPSLRVYSDSCPLSWWCHPTISSSVSLSLSSVRGFSYELTFYIRWPKN